VELNGHTLPPQSYRLSDRPSASGLVTWTLELLDVTLQPGRNDFELRVATAEAFCRQPQALVVNFQPAARRGELPHVDLLSPATHATAAEPRIDVAFRVRSSAKVRRVLLTVGRQTIDLSGEDVSAAGVIERKDLPLEPGPNPIEVRAITDAGAEWAGVTVAYAASPVRLVVEEPRGEWQAGDWIWPEATAPDGKLLVRGHATWPEGRPTEPGDQVVRIYVNGFQQRPARLGPPRGGRRAFETEVTLSEASGNSVELEVPGLPAELGGRRPFRVDCRHPQRNRTLHLLAVGTGPDSGDRLTERVLAALRPAIGPDPRTAGFARIETHALASDDLTPGQILRRLRLLKLALDRRGAAGDVVMISFAGRETTGRYGPALLTGDGARDPHLYALDQDALAAVL
jgi:hypothetical protein